MKLVQLEFFKGRGRKVGLICLGVLLAQMMWMGVTWSRMEPADLAQGWMDLIYSLAITDAVLYPMAAAAIASRSAELEHRGSTWKLLHTLTTPGRLYRAKMIWGALVLAGVLAVRTGLFALLGTWMGFAGACPAGRMIQSFCHSFAICLALYAIQLALSTAAANQAAALVTGIAGSFVGLFALFFPQGVQKWAIWAYFGLLCPVWMDWEPESRIVTYFWVDIPWQNYALLGLWLAGALAAGYLVYTRKEG